MRTALRFVLIGSGACLLFLGGRDLFESYFGQSEVAREFEQPVPERLPADSGPGLAPKRQVDAPQPGDAVAKLIIPRLDAQLYVVEGTANRQLRRGPGHMPGSALPG